MKRNGANLTEGKPVKLILQFAIPVFLGNLFQLFYGLIDTKIVGSTLGEGALAAVGSVSILYNLLTGFFNGLTLGFSVVTARYFGAGDTEKLKKSVAGTILLGFVTAAILVTGVFVFLRPLLSIIPVPGKTVGDVAVFGGLLGEASIIRVRGIQGLYQIIAVV